MTSDTKDVRACGIKDTLEIILITYNRKPFLKKTLDSILDAKSPVREVSVTVLDNCSDDGTGELIEEYAAKFPNIKHIRHAKNIGGNANIARAFEIAQKKYFWVLADDDAYDFSAWDEVEKALREDYDLIIVNTEIVKGPMSFPKMIRLLTFLPAAIHKSINITSEVLINTYYNTSNWFPHLAAVSAVINKNGNIFTCSKNIVISGKNHNNEKISFHRKTIKLAKPYRLQTFETGYLNSLSLIDNKKLRAQACEHFEIGRKSFFLTVLEDYKKNIIEHENYLSNYMSPLASLTFWQKIRFILAVILLHFLYIVKYPRYYKKKKAYAKQLKNETK